MNAPTQADTIGAIWGCVDRDGDMNSEAAETILREHERARTAELRRLLGMAFWLLPTLPHHRPDLNETRLLVAAIHALLTEPAA